MLNLTSLGNEVGVSSNTIREWISLLEASFVIILLQPYHENFGKRLIKSPKLYFTDVGLATYLLGIKDTLQLSRDPLRGALVENLVIVELIKSRINRGLDPQLYFYRDVQGHELDLIFQSSHELIPIEIKSAQSFHKEFLKNLLFFQQLVLERCQKGFLIYTGQEEQSIGMLHILNYMHAANILAS